VITTIDVPPPFAGEQRWDIDVAGVSL